MLPDGPEQIRYPAAQVVPAPDKTTAVHIESDTQTE